MAIDKNFVVKHGLEVNDILIHADPITKRVGIGTDLPEYLLDVRAIPQIGEVLAGIATTTIAIFRGNVTIQGNLDVADDQITVNFAEISNIKGDGLDYTIGTFSNVITDVLKAGFSTSSYLYAGIGTITNLFSTSLISNNANITNLLSAQSGIITNLSGTNLNFGIGTITASYATTAYNTRVEGDILDYDKTYINNVYAVAGIITDFVSDGATITSLVGSNVTYISGEIISLDTTNANVDNIVGTSLTYYSGEFNQLVGISVTTGGFNADQANITNLTGQNSNFGVSTIASSLYLGGSLYDSNNAYGNYGQYLKSLGPNGTEWESFGLLRNREVFVATEGQSEFDFQYDLSTLGDPPGLGIGTNPVALYLDVYLNGVKMVQGEDYIATSGVGITLTTPASAGDRVELNALIDNDLILIDGATITVSNFGENAGISTWINFIDNLYVIGSGSNGITTVGVALSGTYVIDIAGISSRSDSLLIKEAPVPGLYYPTLTPTSGVGTYKEVFSNINLVYNPLEKRLGVGQSQPEYTLDVLGNTRLGEVVVEDNIISVTGIGSDLVIQSDVVAEGDVTAEGSYFGEGSSIVGIVTQIVPGIGIEVFGSQPQGKGTVKIDAYRPVGKTIYVAQTGDDNNTGLAENHPKRTIKAAASVALFGDTVKVFPGVYVEENPILLKKTVSVEGTELRNCVVTPKYPNQDLFFVNNGCHLTDLSFIGPQMTNGAAIVSFERLLGVSTGRYFDAARLIRLNLDYIAKESVGFLTSGFSGFAGDHRAQDAGRLLDLNIDYIAEETVGYLYSTDYLDPPLSTNLTSSGISPNPLTVRDSCKDDIKDIIRCISRDLKANSNRNCISAGTSYYDAGGNLLHINGFEAPPSTRGYSVKVATIDAINYAVGIATYIINNTEYASQPGITTYSNLTQDVSYSPVIVSGGCTETVERIYELGSTITTIIDDGLSFAPQGDDIQWGVNLDTTLCSKDVKDVWKAVCFDITRGGNSKCVGAGKSYFDEDFNLLSIFKHPDERTQTIATLDYSFKVARSIVNNCTWGGYPAGDKINVLDAKYDNVTGITTITTSGPHGLIKDDPTRIVGLSFTCSYSGAGTVSLEFPREGDFGVIFPVQSVIGPNTFTFVGGASTTPHYYTSGGTIQKYENFQEEFTQVKDLGIQPDPETGFNNSVNSCANVISAMHSCIGVVTSIVGLGSTAFSTVGFNTTYPGNSGYGFETIVGIATASYDNTSGQATIDAPGLLVKKGDLIEIRDLIFSCSSGGPSSEQRFPSGYYGYDFNVDKINEDGSFVINVGVSTLQHTYERGGFIINRSVGVTTASYNHITGITTITAEGSVIKKGDLVTLRDLEFSCTSGAGTTTLYPTGNNGYTFEVLNIIGGNANGSDTFVVNVGPSTISHTYQSGGVIIPPFSKGVGNILQGPYVRNCTNFIPGSIGMLVDGVNAEPGDQDDVGVTGAMSVDSYTQYNQGGIGVSITNGAYCQLVSIFTICNDIAIYTGTGGQCDITNSNSSFGRLGLVSVGVGDNTSKSIYRYSGNIILNKDGTEPEAEQAEITVSGIGSYRPYDGQTLYFGELFYTVQSVTITNGGSGYVDDNAPIVTFSDPEGENGITAEGIATVENGQVVSVDLVSTGTQYRNPPTITFTGGGVGVTSATAQVVMTPIYYTIESATLPRAGISTIILNTNLNNTVSVGTTVYFSRLSLQIASSHSFEWVGAGNEILKAKPGLGGVVIQENEIVKIDGGEIVYTSTDQAGNFKIGDGVTVNQLTGTVTGRAFNQSLLNTVTPLIIALGK